MEGGACYNDVRNKGRPRGQPGTGRKATQRKEKKMILEILIGAAVAFGIIKGLPLVADIIVAWVARQ